ncbi:ano10, partial [Symbiodinium sp. KB8]
AQPGAVRAVLVRSPPPERALSPAAPRDGADIQVDVQPKAGAEGGGVARHTGRRRLRSSLGLDVSGGARHKCQEVLEALRRAGLKAKRVRSLNRRKWLIKVRAPEWRLEEEAERLRLRMRRRDGGWSKFRRSIRHAFAVALPWDERPGASVDEAALMALIAARGSLFHSSDRQTLIHHILRSSVREGGAELGSHTPLGAFVVQMFPLHMMARLRALRNDWLSIWRPEAALAELDRIGPAPADDTVPGGASRRQQRAAWAAAFAASQRQTAGHKAQLSNGVTEHPVPEGAVEPFSGKPPSASKRAAGAAARSVGSEGIGQAAGTDADAEAAADGIAGLRRQGLLLVPVRGGVLPAPPLDRIAAYFGETVAFYFAWLEFYTQWLVFPALVGAALFVAQVWYGTVDVTWVPLFSLFMALWSTLFLEFWKRRNAELAHRWGVLNYEHEEVTRPQFRGTWRRDSVTGEVFRVYRTWRRLMKYLVTVPVVMACTGAVVVFMILLFTTRDAILVGIEAAACDRGDVAPDSPMCQRGASAGSLWQPAVDWGILSPTATGKPAAPTDGLNTTATNRILATAATAQAGSTVTAVLGADAGNAAVGWAIRTSASAIVGSASTGRAALAALGLASSPGGALPAGPRRALGANGTNSDEGESGGLLGIGSLSALGVESFEEWISRSGDMEWWLAMLLPPVAYGFLIPIFDFAFGRLAFRFTDWENHKTESLFRNHRIAKVFVFRFVNSFISLFYYAFSPSSSLLQLTVQLASFLLAGQLWNTFLEVVFPCAWRWYKVCRFRQRVQRAVDSGLTEGRRGRRLLRHARSEAWAESRLAEYDTFNDYAEMLIQFGYVTFFSWAFPLAPLCALVNNVFEMRTDAYKLLYNTQRPIAYKAGGIGVWLGVLQGMSLLAVLTNCAHLALASKQFSLYFPGLTDAQKMLVVFLLEHAVLGVKLFLGSVIPHTPERVQKRVARDNFFLARLQGRRSVT